MNKLLLDVYKVEDESQEMLQRRVKECLADGSSFFARFANASGAFRLRFRCLLLPASHKSISSYAIV